VRRFLTHPLSLSPSPPRCARKVENNCGSVRVSCCVHTGARVVCAAEREFEVRGKAALVNLVRVYPVADAEVIEVGRTLVVATGVALVDEATEVAVVQSVAGFGEEVDLEGQEVAAENNVQVAGAIKARIEEKSEVIWIAKVGAVDVNEESEVPARVLDVGDQAQAAAAGGEVAGVASQPQATGVVSGQARAAASKVEAAVKRLLSVAEEVREVRL
jgi:hypothetical protein